MKAILLSKLLKIKIRLKTFGVNKKLISLLLIQIILLFSCYFYIIADSNIRAKNQILSSIKQINTSILDEMKDKVTTLNTVTAYPILKHHLSNPENTIIPYLYKEKVLQDDYITFTRKYTSLTRELLSLFPSLDGLYLFNMSGENLAYNTTNFSQLSIYNLKDQPWFHTIKASKGEFILLADSIPIDANYTDSQPLVYGARVMIDVRNSFHPLGILVAGINVSDIHTSFRRQRLYDSQEYAIYNNQGRLIFSSTNEFNSQVDVISSLKNVYNIMENGKKINYSVEKDDSLGLYCVIKTPASNMVFSSPYGFLLLLFIIIMIIITLFAMVFKSITTPIKTLVKACNRFGQGDFSVRVENHSYDELGYLNHSFNEMAKEVETLINEVYIKDINKRDLELQMLRNQINPHFLYNTLESMRMAAYASGCHDLSNMCQLLASVLRYGVTATANTVTVQEEIKHLQEYIDLQQYRFHYSIRISTQIDPSIEQFHMIKLLLQPMVENAINHGFTKFDGDGQIVIWGYRHENNLIFQISDNGVGMSQSLTNSLNGYINNQNNNFKSIGLKNVHRRIALYYGEEYGLTITSQEGLGTVILLTIPIMRGDKEGDSPCITS